MTLLATTLILLPENTALVFGICPVKIETIIKANAIWKASLVTP
jgi:hypothetical protein